MNRNQILLIGIAITVIASLAVSTLLSTPVGSTSRLIEATSISTSTPGATPTRMVYISPEPVAYPGPEDQSHTATPSDMVSVKQDGVAADPVFFSVFWLNETTVQITIAVPGCVRNISYSQACLTADAGTYLVMPRSNQDWAYHPYRRNSTYGFWPADGSNPYFIYVPYELPRFLPVIRNNS